MDKCRNSKSDFNPAMLSYYTKIINTKQIKLSNKPLKRIPKTQKDQNWMKGKKRIKKNLKKCINGVTVGRWNRRKDSYRVTLPFLYGRWSYRTILHLY